MATAPLSFLHLRLRLRLSSTLPPPPPPPLSRSRASPLLHLPSSHSAAASSSSSFPSTLSVPIPRPRRPVLTLSSASSDPILSQLPPELGSSAVVALQRDDDASLLSSQRIRVLALVAFAMALCNADRVIMSVAIVRLSSLYNWSTSFSGIVQSSFLWGYVLSPIMGGALVDRYGGKTVMACGLALWSLATVLTPWAARQSIFMLLAMRVFLGLAEGVAMPAMNNMISKWFPSSERARAVGVSMAGFHLGIVMGLLVSPVLMATFSIDMPFLAFGFIGAIWLYFWLSSVTNDPQTHPRVGKMELQYIQQNKTILSKTSVASSDGRLSLPFGLLLSKLPSWAIILANFMNNWGYFVLLSWMPVYFSTVYGVDLKQAAWYSALPWTMMAAIGCLAGTCSDYLIERKLSITVVRKIMQSIGFVVPAAALLALNACRSANIAVVWLTVAVGASAFSQAGFLVNFQEVAPKYAGLLHGMANTAGTMGAIISTIGIGYFIQWLGSFQAFLTLTAAMYILSALFWNVYATGERVID